MGRGTTALAIVAGTASAAAICYVVVATARPKRGSSRFKFKAWCSIKWPLTYKWLTALDDAADLDAEDGTAAVEGARDGFNILMDTFTPKKKAVSYDDTTCAARDGYSIPLRVYRPPASQSRRLPVVFYIHGGGWVVGNLDTHHTLCQVAAHDGPFVVVAVDYRLAPEHKYPAALHDCIDALQWVSKNVGSYGGDADRISIAGDSAGGTLSLTTAMSNKAREVPVPLRCMTLVYPVGDATNLATDAYTVYSSGFSLTTRKMQWYWHHYADDCGHDKFEGYMSPALAPVEMFEGLPETMLITAEWDVLRDDSYAVLDKLKAARVNSQHLHYTRSTHGFFAFPTIGSGTDAMAEFVQFVRAASV